MHPFSTALKDPIIRYQFYILFFLKCESKEIKDIFSYVLYFYIWQVYSKKGDIFTATEINDLAQSLFVLLWFYSKELFCWDCTTNFLIVSFCIYLEHFILKIIYNPFLPKF